MKRNQTAWRVPVTGVLLLATAVSAEQDLQTYQNSTNRVSLSLRFGLNISGKFKGVGSSFAAGAPFANNRRTPQGDKYNYDNGYVLPDFAHVVGGNNDQYTWYWGYDNSSQVNPVADTIAFNRTTATAGNAGGNSHDDSPYIGAELTYDYELGTKEEWHHLHYGLELAFNFMPIEFNGGGLYSANASRRTDTYAYTPGTTPPGYNQPGELPYQGSFQGPGFVINRPAISSGITTLTGGTILAQQHFEATLWGFRLGPYIDYPLSDKWSLHLSGGLAVGLLDSEASWKETLTLDGGAGSSTIGGHGTDLDVLFGYYVGLDAAYQISERWGVEAGVQFQDLGTYDHNFAGRTVELDLSGSVFVHAGISYSF